MPYRVGPKGQIVIAKEIRDKLGVQPGWLAVQQLVDGHVEVYFLPPAQNRSLKGNLARYTTVRIPTEEALEQAGEEAWAEAAAERDTELVSRLRARPTSP